PRPCASAPGGFFQSPLRGPGGSAGRGACGGGGDGACAAHAAGGAACLRPVPPAPGIVVPKARKASPSSPLRSPGKVRNDRRYSEYSAS
ncbi:hypothetical protein ACFCX2_37155, partial [Streptomyces sp. NPDC056290]